MKIWRSLFLPFRVFSSGTSFINQKDPAPLKKHIKSQKIKGQSIPMGKQLKIDSQKNGWKHGNLIATIVAFGITTFLFIYLIGFIENTYEFKRQYGNIGLSNIIREIGLAFPSGQKALIYRKIFTNVACTSEIALIQMVILYFVLLTGFRLLLRMLGSISSGEKLPSLSGIRNFMSMAMLCLPGLGILSTAVGILAANDDISRDQAKYIIFGPSAIGVMGVLLSNFFNFVAEYLGEK